MSKINPSEINNKNINSIRRQIFQKQGSEPFFASINDAESIVTDMDHFPYTRFFRGVYSSTDPVVFEREAGWRPIRNSCYKSSCDTKSQYPIHCFENSCSFVSRCHPKLLNRYSDRDALNIQSNNACIVQYR
jgi:hypothetical protein